MILLEVHKQKVMPYSKKKSIIHTHLNLQIEDISFKVVLFQDYIPANPRMSCENKISNSPLLLCLCRFFKKN